MKNKNRIFRAAALLLVLCFISTVMISGTFAKYTSEYSGEDTALIARWSFGGFAGQNSVTIETTTGEQGATLGLFDHAYKTHINQKDTNYIIAPGVNGEFIVAMDYLADVDADVVIGIEGLEGNAAVPVEYSVDAGGSWVPLEDLAKTLVEQIDSTVTDSNTFRIASVAAGSNDAVSILEKVQWRWAYDETEQGIQEEQKGNYAIRSSDITDTGLGVASASDTSRTSYGIKITLTATQVAPGTTTIP